MALPELPDDRRAQPRRYGPADPSAPQSLQDTPRDDRGPGGSRNVGWFDPAGPVEEQPTGDGRRPVAAGADIGDDEPVTRPLGATPPSEGGRGGSRAPLPAEAGAPTWPGIDGGPVNGGQPVSPPTGAPVGTGIDGGPVNGHRPVSPPTGAPVGPGIDGGPINSRRPGPPTVGGAVGSGLEGGPVNGGRPGPPHPGASVGSWIDGGVLDGRRPRPPDGGPQAAPGDENGRIDGRRSVPPDTVAPGRPAGNGGPGGGPAEGRDAGRIPPRPPHTVPPARRDRIADDRTADDRDGPTGVPGRHRRRAGASPEGRPVSSFAGGKPGGTKGGPRSRRRRTSFWKELPLLVLVALLLTFLIQTFVAKVYVIPSGSMETTLHGCTGCNNDRVLVDKITYRFSDPEPGDVVVFRGPDSWGSEITVADPPNVLVRGLQQLGSLIGLAPPDEKDFVKRVIAVGGQTVACCDSRNRVMVNGKALDEPYLYYLPEAGPARQIPFGPVQVPDGELWMMGDSRNNSSDSRVEGHGPVPIENVIGKARLTVLPFDRFGPIAAIDPQSPEPVGMADGSSAPPLALGVLGVLPLAVGRRRRARFREQLAQFLPAARARPRLRHAWRR